MNDASPQTIPSDRPDHAAVLRAHGLSKAYSATTRGGSTLQLFRNLDLTVAAGDSVAIVGRSGSGKSSLLHLLAGLERPTSGEVWLGDTELSRLSPDALAGLRNRELGFVWQFHYLLPEFTAAENVALPLMARGLGRKDSLAVAAAWLARVGLTDRAQNRSGELSGGEQQRVAIARALVTTPKILLADEPTGDLDDLTASQLFSVLQQLCAEEGLAAVIVTHNLDLAGRCHRVLHLRDGRLESAAQ